jgi:hypothetical protein
LYREIASVFGVSANTVAQAAKGLTWKHVSISREEREEQEWNERCGKVAERVRAENQ